jgi:carbonic anhydrase/acetyltransferase-like protein (isoleucine patch superfamily)
LADLSLSSGPLFSLPGKTPRLHPTAWIAPTASVIGDVTVGEGSGIWFHCVVRGDTNFIRIGARTNIQDGSILHVARGTLACIVGDDVTVGHAAIVHACTIENRGFVGMGATVLDGAVIEEGGMLAAGALLSPGKRIGRGELWMGAPAKFVRMVSDAQRAGNDAGTAHYVELAAHYKASLAGVPPLPT